MLCHDPRISNDRSEKVETSNPALMQVEYIRHGNPAANIMWDRVCDAADACDEPVQMAKVTAGQNIVAAGWTEKMLRYLQDPKAQSPDGL